MKNIATLFIKSFRNFNNFKMIFPEKQNNEGENLNLNILIGRNGSGKSNLLDALFDIGIESEPSNVKFDFYTLDNTGENIISNYNSNKGIPVNIKNIDNDRYWDKVVRAHCSNTTRNKEYSGDYVRSVTRLDDTSPELSPYSGVKYSYFSDSVLDFNIDRSKFALFALILSGEYSKSLKEKHSLWSKLNKIVIEECINDEDEDEDNNEKDDNKVNTKELKIKAIWIKAHQGNVNFEDNDKLPPCSNIIPCNDDISGDMYCYYWTLTDIENFYTGPESQKKNEDPNPAYTVLKEYLDEYYCYDMGFLYETEEKGDLYQSSSLSDGQRALLYRFAIVNLLKNEKEKCLLLLDEPETYFNEYWKSYFVYLLWETLKDKPHDVFIATHSAMLITDTKPEEVHRIVDTHDGAYHYKPQVNTYGVSVVDIGKYLFMMESDIGNRAKKEIQKILNQKLDENVSNNQSLNRKINKLLRQVGPGEWRWKLRVKQKEVENKLLGTN